MNSLDLYRYLVTTRADIIMPPYRADGNYIVGEDGRTVAETGGPRSAEFLAAVLNEWHEKRASTE